MRFFTALFIVCCLVGQPGHSQSSETSEQMQALADRAKATVETLGPLLESRQAIAAQVEELVTRIEAAAEAEKEPLQEELELLNAELSEIEDQVSVVSTGRATSRSRAG